MMGSATTLLTGVAPASTTASAPGETAAPEAMDFLLALLAAAPAAPAGAATEAPLPIAAHTDEESSATTPTTDLAALIAAMLPAAVPPAGDRPAAQGEGAEGEAVAAGNTPKSASVARLAAQLLEQLTQAASADEAPVTGESTAPGATATATVAATATQAPKVPPGMALHQLLRTLSQQLDAPEPAAPVTVPAAAGSEVPAPQAFLLPQAAADAIARAAESSAAPAALAGAQHTELMQPESQPQQPQGPQFAVNAPPHQPQAAAPAAAQTLQAPVGTPRWAEELGSRMVMMNLRGQHEGSLNLTPEHLGPLEVRVSVNQGTANVWFGAQHADTRAALAEALPRLRELFADAGLVLGHAGVSHEAPRQNPRDADGARTTGTARGEAADGAELPGRQVSRRVSLGLVDTYA
jgi:flagellar hook-length control protein FliK